MIAKITVVQTNATPNTNAVMPAMQASTSETTDSSQYATVSQKKSDDLNNFLTSPSFNTKQIALESFWKQITQGSNSSLQKPGQS